MPGSYSESALNVIRSAQGHQAKASDPRLGNKPRTHSGLAGGNNLRQGINNVHFNSNYKANSIGSNGNSIKQERKMKRDEANLILSDTGIKISATIWGMEGLGGAKSGTKMIMVSNLISTSSITRMRN